MRGALADAKAVFFDMDNTLYDFERSMEHAFADLRERYVDVFGRFEVTRISEAYWTHHVSISHDEKNEMIHRDADLYRRTMWAGCMLGLGLDKDEAFALEVTRYVETQRPKQWFAAMYPGAADTLQRLRTRYTIGVITNGPSHVQRPKLRGLRYLDHFAEPLVFVSGEFGVRKPDPSIFRAAAKAAGVDPAECVMVGDAREFDMPAKALGFRTILFDGKCEGPECASDPYPPDFVVRTYEELEALF
jgi:HAD superfamily hydrolase (TIGR01509 family)